jgi:hypothetical protein
MSGDAAVVYCCAPTVAWIRDADRMILVEEAKGRCWHLQGVEAVIWDLLTLHYPWDGIVDFLAVLLGASVQEASKTLLAALRDWKEAGIVCTGEETRRG